MGSTLTNTVWRIRIVDILNLFDSRSCWRRHLGLRSNPPHHGCLELKMVGDDNSFAVKKRDKHEKTNVEVVWG